MWITFITYLWALLGFISNSIKFPAPLSQLEEAELIKAHEQGDKAAREKLIEHNLRLVSHIGKKFRANERLDQDDIISLGTIGLIKGVDSFKRNSGTRLATYLSRCIENEILMQIRKQKRDKWTMSLDEPIGIDSIGKDFSLIDVIPDEDCNVEENIIKNSEIEKISCLISKEFSEREKKVIMLRYGLAGGKAKTQAEVADVLGISRSYVSRIETAIIGKLRGKL